SPINLFPNLKLDQVQDRAKKDIDRIEICGFLNSDEIAKAPLYSRHLILPLPEVNLEQYKSWISFVNLRSDMTDEEIMSLFADEGRQPSFAVLLHGSLK